MKLWGELEVGHIIPYCDITYSLPRLFPFLIGTNIDKGIYFIIGDIIIIQYIIKILLSNPR